jgi:hypothetical protein
LIDVLDSVKVFLEGCEDRNPTIRLADAATCGKLVGGSQFSVLQSLGGLGLRHSSVDWGSVMVGSTLALHSFPLPSPAHVEPAHVADNPAALGGGPVSVHETKKHARVVGWLYTGEYAPPPYESVPLTPPSLREAGTMINLGALSVPVPLRQSQEA